MYANSDSLSCRHRYWVLFLVHSITSSTSIARSCHGYQSTSSQGCVLPWHRVMQPFAVMWLHDVSTLSHSQQTPTESFMVYCCDDLACVPYLGAYVVATVQINSKEPSIPCPASVAHRQVAVLVKVVWMFGGKRVCIYVACRTTTCRLQIAFIWCVFGVYIVGSCVV